MDLEGEPREKTSVCLQTWGRPPVCIRLPGAHNVLGHQDICLIFVRLRFVWWSPVCSEGIGSSFFKQWECIIYQEEINIDATCIWNTELMMRVCSGGQAAWFLPVGTPWSWLCEQVGYAQYMSGYRRLCPEFYKDDKRFYWEFHILCWEPGTVNYTLTE